MQLQLESLYTSNGGGALLKDNNGNGYDVPSDFFKSLRSFVNTEDAIRLSLISNPEQQIVTEDNLVSFVIESSSQPRA